MNLFVKIIICVALCAGLGFASGFSTAGEINGWYATIQKPSWNPPNWIFGPVWTTLYVLMGIAAALIWHSKDERRSKALGLFVVQFIFNLAWSFIFFNQHQIGLAFAEIIIMLVLIIATTVSFYKIKPAAAYLMMPYILWVSFATVLNGAIWMLNK
ncbi:MAG: tryptophan-rich sensory protein [Sphingobacteriales bacterium]|nr:MAG: tryptophan-rich sensory protein [Sphingobacteriales bacterium]